MRVTDELCAAPVALHMRVIGCDGSADWLELGAEPPTPVPGVEALPLVYAPDAALRTAGAHCSRARASAATMGA